MRDFSKDPLVPEERDEYETDLIAFSDRELDLLGDIFGWNVLYAGGTSPLWIEGLATRIGAEGSLAVLDPDREGLRRAAETFAPDDLPLTPHFVAGDVFDLPFERNTFDLVYSSGLFHELDLQGREDGALQALRQLARVVRPGGSVATSDFVDDLPASQLDEEAIEAEVARLSSGVELFGIGSADRLVGLHEQVLARVGVTRNLPFRIGHLDKLFLAQPEPEGLDRLRQEDAGRLRRRWRALKRRVEAEGYTRPATLFVRGGVRPGGSRNE